MDVPQLSPELREALRTWFHSKDRSVYLAPNTFAYLPGGVGYLSTAFISETALTASATSVTFSNISQGFRHLMLIGQIRTDLAAELDNVRMRFNGDSAANYDRIQIFGNAAAATVSTSRGQTSIIIVATEADQSRGNNFSPMICWIMDYSRTDAEARAIGLSSVIGNLSADGDVFVLLRAGNWRNVEVITRIELTPATGTNFVSGSRFQLYGVL